MRGPARMLSVAALLAGAPAVSAEPRPAPVQAWIESAATGAGQTFVGRVRSAEPLTGRYQLMASRQGPSGRSSTRQAGSVSLPGGGEQRLSQLALSPLRPEDLWEVVLTVWDADAVVAEHRSGSTVRP